MTLPAYALNRENFPEAYERLLVGPLFRPWVEVLLGRVQLVPGHSLLDVACGTGIVARLAKERLGARGRVVGVDLSPQMLAVAKAHGPDVEWREGSAAALPVGKGEAFDVVTCQQGLQFFPDRPAAVREMRRVLAPGGRVAIATWRPLDEVPFFRDLGQIAERHVGPITDQRHAFGAARDLEALLAGAGFRDVRVETVTRTIRFSDPASILHLNAMAVVGMSTAGKTMTDDERAAAAAAIAAECASVVPRYADGSGIAFELGTNVAAARS
jgi:ubiquinone/menaquinone biosynthesis C-methylase UbiE